MLKNYKIGFNQIGLILFLIIMIPNFIWFVVPAPDDVLRTESVTGTIDNIASVCQVLMVASLCLIINRNHTESKVTGTIIAVIACICFYYICWFCYYQGNADTAVLTGLTVFPCAAFLIYSYKKRNMIAAFFAGVFSVCHLIYAIVNFVVQKTRDLWRQKMYRIEADTFILELIP